LSSSLDRAGEGARATSPFGCTAASTEATVAPQIATQYPRVLVHEKLERGSRIADRYRLDRVLGEGGMGVVWAATHEITGKPVAIKLVKVAGDAAHKSRMAREARAAGAIRHPNVCEVHELLELDDGSPVMVMELLVGESLEARLVRERKLGLADFAAIFLPVLDACGAAHAIGIVHRDLKPANIFLASAAGAAPIVKVLDFGIAKLTASEGEAAATAALTATGSLLGTPHYMSPEQVFGEKDVDARADVWALGLILYRSLSGVLPTEADNVGQVFKNILTQPVRPLEELEPGLPREVTSLARRMLSREREGRPADLGEVARIVARCTAACPPEIAAPPAAMAETILALPSPSPNTSSVPLLPSPDDRAVAVVPFKNLGPADDDYIAAGLTEDLLDALAMVRGIKVRAAGAGAASGVDVVVEGSVRRAGERLRINARLVNVADGFQLWSQRFDRALSDLLAANDEAVQSIADALSAHHGAPRREAATDPAAIELYLRALHANRDGSGTFGIDLLEQALACAPRDPAILAFTAISLARRTFMGGPGALDDLARARDLADRAIEVAPHLPEPYVALAHARFNTGDHAGAASAIRRALRAGPSVALANEIAGRILLEVGLLSEGLAYLERARWLEPFVGIWQDLIRGYHLLGEPDRAKDLVESLDLEARSHVLLLANMVRMQMWRRERLTGPLPAAKGPALLQKSLEHMARVLETDVVDAEAFAFFDGLVAQMPPDTRPRRLFLQIRTEALAFVDRIDEAERSLRRTVEEGLLDIAWMDHCPLLAPLRERPSFAGLHARVAERALPVVKAWRAEGPR
jgi:serine/threonine-protein kinase